MSGFAKQFCPVTDAAFGEFFADVVTYSGERRESGATRQLSLTITISLLDGDAAEQASGAVAANVQRAYTALIRRADWPDHTPPQNGDTITADGYPVMRVMRVNPGADDSWALDCVSRGAA